METITIKDEIRRLLELYTPAQIKKALEEVMIEENLTFVDW